MTERKYPPVTGIAMTSLGLIVAGGIYLSAHLPRHVPIGPAVVLLVLSALLMAYNIYSLTRVKDFPWDRFFAVAKWSLLAYLVIAGLIEYAFLKNHLSGAPLVVLTLSLGVMDATSVAMCRDNKLPIIVFNLNTNGNIMRMSMGEPVGTIIR